MPFSTPTKVGPWKRLLPTVATMVTGCCPAPAAPAPGAAQRPYPIKARKIPRRTLYRMARPPSVPAPAGQDPPTLIASAAGGQACLWQASPPRAGEAPPRGGGGGWVLGGGGGGGGAGGRRRA